MYRHTFFRRLYGLFEGIITTFCDVYTQLFRGPEFSDASEFQGSQIGVQCTFKSFFVSGQITVTFRYRSIVVRLSPQKVNYLVTL